jgi:hypothetical protein
MARWAKRKGAPSAIVARMPYVHESGALPTKGQASGVDASIIPVPDAAPGFSAWAYGMGKLLAPIPRPK